MLKKFLTVAHSLRSFVFVFVCLPLHPAQGNCLKLYTRSKWVGERENEKVKKERERERERNEARRERNK